MPRLDFAVIGAGNGGQTVAAVLAANGFPDTSVYDISKKQIDEIVERGGIKVVGKVMDAFVPIRCATNNLAEALDRKNVILVVTTAPAHESVARSLAPHVSDDQIIVLMPGYLGTLVFRRVFSEMGVKAKVRLAETISLPYATRLVGPAEVGLRAVKRSLDIAALPADDTARVIEALRPAFPQLNPRANVLEVGGNNPNPTHHVPVTVFNMGRVESPEVYKGFFYSEWSSPSIERVSEKLEDERARVLRALGLAVVTATEFSQVAYNDQAVRGVPTRGEIPPSSASLPPRYIEEDVPMGLVPIAWLGDLVGVDTPATDLMISVAGLLKGCDYRETGRTARSLGVEGMGAQEILGLVTGGL